MLLQTTHVVILWYSLPVWRLAGTPIPAARYVVGGIILILRHAHYKLNMCVHVVMSFLYLTNNYAIFIKFITIT